MGTDRAPSERAKPWVWLGLIFAAMLLFHGIGESDISDFLVIAPKPFDLTAPLERQFLYSSPLNYFLAWALNLATPLGFYLIHGLEILGMLAVILICLRKKFPSADDQIRFLALLSLTPLWLVTLKWIGKPDPILISLLFLSWAYPGNWRLLFSLIMVMAHREMGTFMCIFLFVCEEGWDYRLLMPLPLGYAFHHYYQHVLMDHVPGSRLENWSADIWKHPKQLLARPVIYLLSAFSWLSIILIEQKPAMRLGLALAAAFGIAGVCEDFTRDFILLALAPILLYLETVVKTPKANELMKFLPLGLLQFQIAYNGIIFKPNNIWLDMLTGHLGRQLIR